MTEAKSKDYVQLLLGIISVLLLCVLAVLGWLHSDVREVRQDLSNQMQQMGTQLGNRMDQMDSRVRDNTTTISSVEAVLTDRLNWNGHQSHGGTP